MLPSKQAKELGFTKGHNKYRSLVKILKIERGAFNFLQRIPRENLLKNVGFIFQALNNYGLAKTRSAYDRFDYNSELMPNLFYVVRGIDESNYRRRRTGQPPEAIHR